VLRTGDDDRVDRARIGWRARCSEGGRYTSRTIFVAPLDSSTATAFRATGDYRAKPSGYTAHIHATIKGSWRAAKQRWRGTFSARVRVVRHGETIDVCRVKQLSWSAGPA
jgi:hypothetical protein